MLSTPAAPDQLLSVTAVPDARPGRVVVEVVGEVDASTAPVLDACLASQAGRPGVAELVVDLGQVTFLGAAGVAALARAHRGCRARGARMVIRTGGRRCVLRLLELTGLAARVDVAPARVGAPSRGAAGAGGRTMRRRYPARRRVRR
ncbi:MULTISPECIES: STAS domain-containing protein [unclassified Modestobacter]